MFFNNPKEVNQANFKFKKIIGSTVIDVTGDWIFTEGTNAYNFVTGEIPEDMSTQILHCIQNIEAILEEFEIGLERVPGGFNFFVSDVEAFHEAIDVLDYGRGLETHMMQVEQRDFKDTKVKVVVEALAFRDVFYTDEEERKIKI